MMHFLMKKNPVFVFLLLSFMVGLSAHAQQTVTIKNRWTGVNIGLQNGTPYSSTSASDTWVVEQVGEANYIRLKHVPSGIYLHTETGKLGAGTIQPGWLSAMWTLNPVDGYQQIVNRWTGVAGS